MPELTDRLRCCRCSSQTACSSSRTSAGRRTALDSWSTRWGTGRPGLVLRPLSSGRARAGRYVGRALVGNLQFAFGREPTDRFGHDHRSPRRPPYPPTAAVRGVGGQDCGVRHGPWVRTTRTTTATTSSRRPPSPWSCRSRPRRSCSPSPTPALDSRRVVHGDQRFATRPPSSRATCSPRRSPSRV